MDHAVSIMMEERPRRWMLGALEHESAQQEEKRIVKPGNDVMDWHSLHCNVHKQEVRMIYKFMIDTSVLGMLFCSAGAFQVLVYINLCNSFI